MSDWNKKIYQYNRFSISFTRNEHIRRKSNDIEDKLKESYPSIHQLPIPDELDSMLPRLILDSRHGFSQIVISQSNIALNINYSEDWQDNIDKCRVYLLEKIKLLFDLVGDVIGEKRPYYCGLVSQIHILPNVSDREILNIITDKIETKLNFSNSSKLTEVDHKFVNLVSEKFYSGLQVKNFKSWNIESVSLDIPRLKEDESFLEGILIIGDFNDRYKFNEDKKYFTNLSSAKEIIDLGIKEAIKFSDNFIGS